MKVGDLVRPMGQPINKDQGQIELGTLGIIQEVYGMEIKVKWPDGRVFIFHIGDLENLDNT